MNSADIDRIIERYTEERKHAPRQIAQEHLLSYTYLVCSSSEIGPFLNRIRSLVTFQIDSLMLFDNPFRNSQACWLLFIPAWFFLSLSLLAHQESVLLGLINCAGTVIFGTSLFLMVINKWMDTCIQVAYYREILDLIDSQELTFPGELPN